MDKDRRDILIATIDFEKFLKKTDKRSYMVDGKVIDYITKEPKKVSSHLIPEVHKKLVNLGRIEKCFQNAIINAALIMFLEVKEQELGIDLIKLVKKRPVNDISHDDIGRVLPKRNK